MGCEAQTACNTPTSATPHLPGQRTKRWVSESEDYYENDADNENTDTTGTCNRKICTLFVETLSLVFSQEKFR